MNQGAGGFINSHTLTHPSTCDTAGGAYHACTQILDNGAGSKKIYFSAAQGSLVLPSQYQETDNNGTTLLLQKNFTWGTNAAGNAFVSRVDSTLNPGSSNSATTSTVQSVDLYGNLTQQQVYDYGSSTISRTYNMTYLTDANYTSRYIRNRLAGATVTASGVQTTLTSRTYDGTGLGPLQAPKDVLGNSLPLPAHDSAYDASFTYRGNLTAVSGLSGSMLYAYDIGGNPYETQDGNGMIVSVSTSSSTGASLPSTLTPNSNGNLASNMTYSTSYSLTSVTGADGANKSVLYDGYNRPSQSTSVDGAVTNYAYAYGPNTQTATISTTVNNNTTTQWRRTTFDGFGRTIKLETGHDGTIYNTVDTVYGACGCSPLGKVVKVSMPYAAGETEVWTTYTYDGSGRQLGSAVPDGSVTAISYAGNSVTTTDPAGIWKKNVSDAFGNLIAVYEPDPATGSPSTGPVTNYTYNGASQLTNVSMVRGTLTQTRTFGYSGADLTSEITPEAGTVTYSYDGNHHVTQRTDALGQQTQYSYDAYERLVEVRHYVSGTEQTRQRVDYVYDTPIPGGYTQNNTWGRLSAVKFQGQTPFGFDLDFAYEYSYNQAGRVTGNRMLANGGGMQVFDLQAQYGWDNQGRMNSMTYPSGPVMSYTFDAMGRPTGMSETACVLPGGQTCTTQSWGAFATYGSAGQILTLGGSGHLGTGVYQGTPYDIYGGSSETRTYNSMLQLTHLTGSAQSTGPTGPPSSVGGNMDIQYVYSTGHNNGRVTQTIDNILGETVNYTYDYLHRLTGATATNNAWGEAYSYDGFGNLTAKTPTVGSAPTFSGSAGSNVQNGYLPGQWDVENRPMTQGSTFYVYDPWGRRIWKQWTGQTGANECEAYFYGATGQKLESYSCEYTPNTTDLFTTLEGINTYFGGKMLSEKGVFVATDRLGSVRGNSSGESFSYFPWGEERGAGTADGRTKFAGYYRDQPGQDYAMARYYSATTGSFWSPDPGGMKTADGTNPGSWNRYGYVVSDPINHTDHRGLYLDAEDCINNPDLCSGCLPGANFWGTPPGCDEGGGGDGAQVGGGSDDGDNGPTCEQQEIDYLTKYLNKYNSPLASLASTVFSDSQTQGLDDRFIVALAGIESRYGTKQHDDTWGHYNVFSNGHHCASLTNEHCVAIDPYTSFTQAIDAVTQLIGSSALYQGLDSTSAIYSLYETGDASKKSGGQGILDQIYGQQLGGDLDNVRSVRWPSGGN